MVYVLCLYSVIFHQKAALQANVGHLPDLHQCEHSGVFLLFFWTTILIHGEDELIRNEDQLLLSLSLNTTGEHPKSHAAIRAAHELKAANHIIRNQRSLIDGKTVLVPITLKQVRGKITNPNDEEEDEIDSTSIGVQTSGGMWAQVVILEGAICSRYHFPHY
uniref:Uncharacterized protein n=1 Tax=Ditylenchus dipsaci TaxID=166011 RepID=A0A915DGZ0_9BILA